MAQLVIAAAGAAIGGATLGTGVVAFGLTGTAIGWAAGSMLGGLLQKGPNQQGPRLNDLRVTGTEYGQAHPWAAGSPRLPGQIVWASNKREIRNTQKVGKGGGGQRVTTFTYEVDLLYRLTENEIAGVSRIWSNGELVYNGTTTKAGVWNEVRIYTGAPDQMPDPTYEAAVGAGNAPAYRGGGTVLIRGLQLGQSGQIPNLTFEIGGVISVEIPTSVLLSEPATSSTAPNEVYGGLVTTDLGLEYLQGLDNVPTFQLKRIPYGSTTPITVDNVPMGTRTPLASLAWLYGGRSASDIPCVFFAGTSNGFTVPILRGDGTHISISLPGLAPVQNEFLCMFQNSVYVSPRNSSQVLKYDPLWSNSTSPAFWSSISASSPVLPMTIGWMDVAYNSIWALGINQSFPTNSQNVVYRLNKDTLQLQETISLPGVLTIRRSVDGRLFAFALQNTMWEYINGSFVIVSSSTFPSAQSSNSTGFLHFSDAVDSRGTAYRRTKITSPDALTRIWKGGLTTQTGAGAPEPIQNVLSNLMGRAGYQASDYDIEAEPGAKDVRGFAIGQIGSTRASLEVLQKAWYFEASKSDKIYIRPRAVTPVATIPWADLGTAEDIDSDQEPLALQIGSDLELPAQIALSYNNMAADYNVATENSDRLITNQLSTATVQMPLGMLPDEAKGVANALLFDQLASLTTTTIRVPLKYAYIEPGDVVNAVNFDGRTYRIRVIAKRDTLSILELECALDDVGALDSAAITDNSYISITDPAQIAPTLFEPLDIPILRDADDNAGYYAAVASDRLSPSDEWPGAVYVQAFSPGAFEQEFTTGDSCVMGEALTILPNWTGGNEFDESSTVEVEVVGELESSTRDQMLADLTVNAMLIGSEVIRFRLATLLSADGERRTYRLSGLLRGQRGTEWAIGGHVADERVILLNNALRRVSGLLTQIGLERDVKAVTLNTLLSDVADVAFTNEAIGLKPFAPANVVALADGADLRITWQRRTRLSVRYGGPVDQVVPLGEVAEQYRVRIFDGPTLVHTATVTTPEYLYTDLTADGFASGDPVTVEVAQLSAIVGAGYPTIKTGTAP